MSRADEFRQSTEEFWSEIDQKRKVGRGRPQAKADEFRQYAVEALRWAHQSKTEKEKEALIDLAGTWMQATLESESSRQPIGLALGVARDAAKAFLQFAAHVPGGTGCAIFVHRSALA
jgi:hypothetical protein